MKNSVSKMIIVFLAACSVGKVAYSCWTAVPFEEIVKQNPLIVAGNVEKVVVVKPRGHESGYDTAFIKVRKVLKDDTKNPNIKTGAYVRLSMPSINNKYRSSVDLLYQRGQDGIWLLSYDNERGAFRTGRPDQLQPLSQEQKIKEIISVKAPTTNKTHR
jgi:hypothetical protein